jgi:ribonucleotide monophosphatase NagD (HAD superfamily)
LFLIEEALGMTNSNGSSDRLDRIEALMEQQAEESIRQAAQWAETRQIVESNARAIAANSEQMSQQSDQWAETRQIVESNARAIAANSERMSQQSDQWAETRQIVESNAKSIVANSDAMARQREELRANVTDLVNMITASAEQAEIDRVEFRATVRQLLETLNQRFTSNGH